MPDDAKRLQHMLEAISEIERLIGTRSLDDLDASAKFKDAKLPMSVILSRFWRRTSGECLRLKCTVLAFQ
jgi:hypothetical protein